MVANFKNQCSSFNVNGKRCRMKSLNDSDICYFHNKKKCFTQYSDKSSGDESGNDYGFCNGDYNVFYSVEYVHTMERIDNVENSIYYMNEQLELNVNKLECIEHTVNIQRYLIVFLFILYMYLLYINDPDYSKNEINTYIVEPLVSYIWLKTKMVKEYINMNISHYYNNLSIVMNSSYILDNNCSIDEIITMYMCANETPIIHYKNISNS